MASRDTIIYMGSACRKNHVTFFAVNEGNGKLRQKNGFTKANHVNNFLS